MQGLRVLLCDPGSEGMLPVVGSGGARIRKAGAGTIIVPSAWPDKPSVPLSGIETRIGEKTVQGSGLPSADICVEVLGHDFVLPGMEPSLGLLKRAALEGPLSLEWSIGQNVGQVRLRAISRVLRLDVASEELVAWMGVERQIQLEVQRGLTMMDEALGTGEEYQLLLSGPEMVRDSRVSSALKRSQREVQMGHSRVELEYAQLLARRGSELEQRTRDDGEPLGSGGLGVVGRAQSYFRGRSRANNLLVRAPGEERWTSAVHSEECRERSSGLYRIISQFLLGISYRQGQALGQLTREHSSPGLGAWTIARVMFQDRVEGTWQGIQGNGAPLGHAMGTDSAVARHGSARVEVRWLEDVERFLWEEFQATTDPDQRSQVRLLIGHLHVRRRRICDPGLASREGLEPWRDGRSSSIGGQSGENQIRYASMDPGSAYEPLIPMSGGVQGDVWKRTPAGFRWVDRTRLDGHGVTSLWSNGAEDEKVGSRDKRNRAYFRAWDECVQWLCENDAVMTSSRMVTFRRLAEVLDGETCDLARVCLCLDQLGRTLVEGQGEEEPEASEPEMDVWSRRILHQAEERKLQDAFRKAVVEFEVRSQRAPGSPLLWDRVLLHAREWDKLEPSLPGHTRYEVLVEPRGGVPDSGMAWVVGWRECPSCGSPIQGYVVRSMQNLGADATLRGQWVQCFSCLNAIREGSLVEAMREAQSGCRSAPHVATGTRVRIRSTSGPDAVARITGQHSEWVYRVAHPDEDAPESLVHVSRLRASCAPLPVVGPGLIRVLPFSVTNGGQEIGVMISSGDGGGTLTDELRPGPEAAKGETDEVFVERYVGAVTGPDGVPEWGDQVPPEGLWNKPPAVSGTHATFHARVNGVACKVSGDTCAEHCLVLRKLVTASVWANRRRANARLRGVGGVSSCEWFVMVKLQLGESTRQSTCGAWVWAILVEPSLIPFPDVDMIVDLTTLATLTWGVKFDQSLNYSVVIKSDEELHEAVEKAGREKLGGSLTHRVPRPMQAGLPYGGPTGAPGQGGSRYEARPRRGRAQ